MEELTHTNIAHHVARCPRPFRAIRAHLAVSTDERSKDSRTTITDMSSLSHSLLNTNVDGKNKIMYALTEVKGVGRRFANIVCKKADIDLSKR